MENKKIIIKVLTLMLEEAANKKRNYSGLCQICDHLLYTRVISNEEYSIIGRFIYGNKKLKGYFAKVSSVTPFSSWWWTIGDMDIRYLWISSMLWRLDNMKARSVSELTQNLESFISVQSGLFDGMCTSLATMMELNLVSSLERDILSSYLFSLRPTKGIHFDPLRSSSPYWWAWGDKQPRINFLNSIK